MAAPLSTCTTIEQRGVVRFLWAKKNGSKGYPQRNAAHVGEHCLSHQAVHNWMQKSSEGRTSIEDEHRAGRPVEIAWFRQQPKEFYAAGFQGLVKQWDKCLNLYGEYVEK